MKKNKAKIVAYFGMIALLASLILGLLGFSNNTNEINNVKNQLLRRHVENNINLTMKYITNYYGVLSQGDKTLLDSNGKSIEGRHEAVDAISMDLGDKSTIFVRINDDFKRISTNITDENNERAVDTFLGANHAAHRVALNGEIYIGEAEILGNNYYTAYKPIKDINDNVIGLLFVGTPTTTLDNIIKSHDVKLEKFNILIIVLRAISLGSLIFLVSASISIRKNKCLSPEISKNLHNISDELLNISKEMENIVELPNSKEKLSNIITKLNDLINK